MDYNKLILIGNGFDLHFGLPTSYNDFKSYVEDNYVDEKGFIEYFFECSDKGETILWSDFENNLEKINKKYFFEYVRNQDEAKALYGDLIQCKNLLTVLFESWVKSISCDLPHRSRRLIPNSFVINFNYTPTLEQNFNVCSNQIYHIHGTTKNDIIFGHKQGVRYYEKAPCDMDLEDYKNYNPFRPAMVSWLNEYLQATEKPIDRIITKSEKLLISDYGIDFKKIKEIYVIGLSYSEVDMPYLEWFSKRTKARWNLGWFNGKGKEKAEQTVKQSGITFSTFSETKDLVDEILLAT